MEQEVERKQGEEEVRVEMARIEHGVGVGNFV